MGTEGTGLRVVITGGSAGLGLALTRMAAAAGHDVVAVGRRRGDELWDDWDDTAAHPAPRYVQADLATAEGRAGVVAAVAAWPVIDRLVHNAGVGKVADVADHAIADIVAQIEVNLTAPINLTHALFDQLAAGRGQVVFVSSTAVRRAQPKFPVYTASKAAIDAFARNLKTETRGRLKVTTHHPGPLRTDFHRRAGMKPTVLRHLFTPPEREARRLARKIGLEAAA